MEGYIPIQVKLVCSTFGEMTPLWFRFENKEHKVDTIFIDKILNTKEEKITGINTITYTCKSRNPHFENMFLIRYYVKSHVWKLIKVFY